MTEFSLDDLRQLLRASVGVDEGVDLDGDIADREFVELGYDSLAVAEVISQVRRRLGVPIPEDAAVEITTPGAAVAFINARLAEAVG